MNTVMANERENVTASTYNLANAGTRVRRSTNMPCDAVSRELNELVGEKEPSNVKSLLVITQPFLYDERADSDGKNEEVAGGRL